MTPNRVSPEPEPNNTITYKVILKPRPSKSKIVWKWVQGLACGTLSCLTCACGCGGCCGALKAPAVLYDEDAVCAELGLTPEEQRVVRPVQWCGLAALACRCVPTCGCCCGCCGVITPAEALECIATKR